MLLIALALAQTGGPDAFGYQYEPTVFDFVDLSAAGGTPLGLGDDNGATVTLPWAFSYYGVDYTGIRVGANGGIRFDVALKEPEFAVGLAREFVGGQLKLAPEHSVPHVLELMRKTDFAQFDRFLKLFERTNRETGKEQYVIPYVMSAFPGCTMADMQSLRDWFRQRGWSPQQVQCFVPTPGTVATAMYYAGCDPAGDPIHVARTDREREDQHAALVGRGKGRKEQTRPGARAPGRPGRRRRP